MSFQEQLEAFHNAVMRLEPVIINVVSATTPWLAPVMPAALTIYHVGTVLLSGWFPIFQWSVAIVAGLSVEFLGLGAISTALELWRTATPPVRNPKGKKATGFRWPRLRVTQFGVAVVSGLFYVLIVLTVNALLELNKSIYARVFATALLSLLSVDAAVIIALRAKHRARQIAASDGRKARRKVSESFPSDGNVSESSPKVSEWPDDWRKLSTEQKRQIPELSDVQLMTLTGITPKSVGNWRQRAAQLNGVHHETPTP